MNNMYNSETGEIRIQDAMDLAFSNSTTYILDYQNAVKAYNTLHSDRSENLSLI